MLKSNMEVVEMEMKQKILDKRKCMECGLCSAVVLENVKGAEKSAPWWHDDSTKK